MRAVIMGLILQASLSWACVGGPGPLPTEGSDGVPVEQTSPSEGTKSESSGGTSSGNSSSSSSSSSQPSGGTTSSGGTTPSCADQCAPLNCTCGRFATKVQQCVNGTCAKTCAEAGCT
jgi:hypothetical protein